MAIDTRQRRLSMFFLSYTNIPFFPDPDGSNWATSPERAMGGLRHYFGIGIVGGQPIMIRHGGIPYSAGYWNHQGSGQPNIGRSW